MLLRIIQRVWDDGPGRLFSTLAVAASVLSASSALAQTKEQTDREHAEALIEELRSPFEGDVNSWVNSWAGSIRSLIEMGSPAVEPVCEALRTTDDEEDLRRLAFVLRGIGDPRAVPTLIEAIPRTLLPMSSDSGFKASDPDLHKFMLEHDVDWDGKAETDMSESFGLNRPGGEIFGALRKITGHSFNERDLLLVFLTGSPHQQYLKREMFHDNALQWKSWWESNAHKFDVPEPFRTVNIPVFETEMHDGIDVFSEGNGVVSEHHVNVVFGIMESYSERAFLDIDTGKWATPPEALTGDPANLEAITTWARDNGVDLFCSTMTLPGNDKPIYAIRTVDLEMWQNEPGKFDALDNQIQAPLDKLGTPATDFLIWKDPASGELDPNHQATFLFRTRDGTCGAVKYICIVDRLLTMEEYKGRSIDAIIPNAHIRLGVRVETKVFAPEEDE